MSRRTSRNERELATSVVFLQRCRRGTAGRSCRLISMLSISAYRAHRPAVRRAFDWPEIAFAVSRKRAEAVMGNENSLANASTMRCSLDEPLLLSER